MSDQSASNQDEARGTATNASPGSRLRAARQARGLDVDRVAAELHLAPERIAALERDDYEAMPGSVFVMGYMRNYARLLRLDPEPLLEAYRAATPDAVVGQPRPVRTAARKAGSGHLPLALASLAIVLAAGGLSYYWWQQGRGIPRASAPAPQGEALTAPGTRTPTPPLAAAPDQTPAANQPPAPPGTRAAEASPAEPSVAQATPEPAEAAAETAAGSAAPAAPRGAEDTATAPEADAPPDDAPGAPAEAETETAPAASEREVVMSFSGPCWVDIRDSGGGFKLFGEMGKGDRRVLGGTPPYSLILGNTAAVSITVGGEPYDLDGIARGNVARFTLDPAGQP